MCKEDLHSLTAFQEEAFATETSKCKYHQKAKFNGLTSDSFNRRSNTTEEWWVINMSMIPLSDSEMEVLKHFAPYPLHVPV